MRGTLQLSNAQAARSRCARNDSDSRAPAAGLTCGSCGSWSRRSALWRMAAHAENKHWRAFQARVERERPGYLAALEREIAERAPLTFGELRDPARREKVQTKYAGSSLLCRIVAI